MGKCTDRAISKKYVKALKIGGLVTIRSVREAAAERQINAAARPGGSFVPQPMESSR
jgi:hypothetical protein